MCSEGPLLECRERKVNFDDGVETGTDPLEIHNTVSSKAYVNYFQSQHRRNAIKYGLHAVMQQGFQSAGKLDDGMFGAFQTNLMAPWVCETICQGAFLREYHVWEKEIREFISTKKREQDKSELGFDGDFLNSVKKNLSKTGLAFPQELYGKFHKFRNKVNTAKHSPGLLTEHFVSEGEVWEVNDMVRDFWANICQQEGRPIRFPLPLFEPAVKSES